MKQNHIVRYKKRTFFARIDKIESMPVDRLKRFHRMFYTRGLKLIDLIILQRLGAIPKSVD